MWQISRPPVNGASLDRFLRVGSIRPNPDGRINKNWTAEIMLQATNALQVMDSYWKEV